MEEKEFIDISKEIPEILENEFINENNNISAFKLGYWYEKVSPEIDFEKSYLWYSVSVSAGVYKAMKIRDRVGGLIEKNKITEIQKEARKHGIDCKMSCTPRYSPKATGAVGKARGLQPRSSGELQGHVPRGPRTRGGCGRHEKIDQHREDDV